MKLIEWILKISNDRIKEWIQLLPKLYENNMGWGSLRFMKRFIKRKLFQPMLYEYNLGSYWIHSLWFNFLLISIID